MKVDEVNVFPSPMPRDLEQIADTGEAAFASETRRNLFDRDRRDGVDFDLPTLELISPPSPNLRTHPNPNAPRNRPAPNPVAQVFREQHRASLA